MRKVKVLKNDKHNSSLKRMLEDFEDGKFRPEDKPELIMAVLVCLLIKNKEYFHDRNVSRRRALKVLSRLAGFNNYIVKSKEGVIIIARRLLTQEKALI